MKILMVNKFLYPRGGAETYFLEIGRYLQKQGHQIQYFGMQDEENIVGNQLGLETYPMDFRSAKASRFLYPLRIIYSREAKKKIQRLARAFKPDVIHLNNVNFQLTPSVVDGAYELGIPLVQTVHDFQMLCPNHMMLNGREKAPCERCVEGSKWNCARYRCIHGSLAKSVLGSLEGTIYKKRRNYERIARFICPSRFIEAMLLRDRRFMGKTAVLQNFVHMDGRPKGMQKRNYVLYFGRLAEEKDFPGFLEACRLCPDIPFIVAGSGPLEGLLESAPPNVKCVGFQSGEALNRLIAEAQFSVYLPIWYENCPLSVLESQSLGTPVLANRIGGIPELIAEGETGTFTQEFTPENYAKHIRTLYEDRNKLAEMSKNCIKQRNFLTLEQYCGRLMDIYHNL